MGVASSKHKPAGGKVNIPVGDRQAVLYWAKAQLAEKRFIEFVRQAWHIVEPDKPFIENWHIEGICEHLEAVLAGQIQQLLINIPPGTTKSSLVCVFWPAWSWIKRPELRWFFASYSDHLTTRDSIRCRRIIRSDWYERRWGKTVELSGDQDLKTHFQNTRGGSRLASSVGGASLGEHPDVIGVDDPHKVKEVESETERQSVIDWWDGVMGSRGIIRDVRRVVIMQRLHAKDLSQHLMDKGGWEIICLPMRFEEARMKPTRLGWEDPRKQEGELLWPAVYSEAKVNQMEKDMGLYHAAGQMQQRPTPRGGGMFKIEWFEILVALPVEPTVFVRYWDKAGTKGGQGAQTSGVLMGRTARGLYVVVDVVSGRWGAAEREGVIKQTAHLDRRAHGPVETCVEQEPGSGGKESAENTVRNLEGFHCTVDKVTGAKELRAEPLAAQASVQNVKLLLADWNRDFLTEAEMFPLGKLKDMIDAGSGAFNRLAAGVTHNISEGHVSRSGELSESVTAGRLGRDDF